MPGSDLHSWNQRYLAGEFGFRETDPFVMEAHKDYLQPLLRGDSAAETHTGLDLAGGAGHHAVWLAQQGWRMTLADWSQPALEIAREKAAASQVTLDIQQGSALNLVSEYAAGGHRFGFVLVSFFLDRPVLPWLPKILIQADCCSTAPIQKTMNASAIREGREIRNIFFVRRSCWKSTVV